ncbi:MAG: hypothetical protein HOP28_07665 [Gemmatimonadales bacterium]|nr:hypothetical protein [Gemmatimonadales bacterium]
MLLTELQRLRIEMGPRRFLVLSLAPLAVGLLAGVVYWAYPEIPEGQLPTTALRLESAAVGFLSGSASVVLFMVPVLLGVLGWRAVQRRFTPRGPSQANGPPATASPPAPASSTSLAEGFAAVIGLLSAFLGLASIGLIGWQLVHYLQPGSWVAVSVLGFMNWADLGREWVLNPTSWLGLWRALDAIPASITGIVLAVIVGGIAGALGYEA